MMVGISSGTHYLLMGKIKPFQEEETKAKVQACAPIIDTTPDTTLTAPIDIFSEGWLDFDRPKFLYEFEHNHLEEVAVSYDSIIPKTTKAKYVKMMFLMKAGPEPTYS